MIDRTIKNAFGDVFFPDWYSGVISEGIDNILEALSEPLGIVDFRPVNGVPQYDRTIGLFTAASEKEPVMKISYGGNNEADPHFQSTGHNARITLPVLRTVLPVHFVTRYDVAVDFVGEGLYEAVSVEMMRIHEDRGIATKTINHDVPEMGRTHYLGSRTSRVMVRLYEKGKQMERARETFIPHHVRLEIEVKPKGRPDRARWAAVPPPDAWGASPWTARLAKHVLDMAPEAIIREPPMPRTDEEKWAYILNQHKRTALAVGEERAIEMLRQLFAEGTDGVSRSVAQAALH